MSSVAIPPSHIDLLAMPIAPSLATIGPGDAPHCTPVWFDWDGEVIRISLTTQRQKYGNLVARPACALAFVDPDDMYRSLEVRGTATSIDPDSDNGFLNSLAARYMGIETYDFDAAGTERVVVTITPTHATSWS